MILDERNEFADATALSQIGTGLALVGDVIDLGAAGELGAITDLWLVVQVDTTVLAGGGASSVAFVLASDAQAAIAADGSATEHFRTAAIAKATLVAGYEVCQVQVPRTPAFERYVGILQDVSTNALTAGKINAFLTTDPTFIKAYADALTV